MTIDFQTITGKASGRNVETPYMDVREGYKASNGKADSVGGASIIAELGSSFFSNDAYGQHSRTADSISEMAQNTDVWMQHNYMALLSNTMSEEDYAKALEDGYDLKNIDSSETVTIVDKIKSELLKSGVEIAGYNDDLSVDKLARITGSRVFAQELRGSFHENDIPMTSDNVRDAKLAYEEISDVKSLDDGALKYLVMNDMAPTIENIYFAAHSSNGQNVSGRGFYAQDAGGYYAQKADSYDWQQLASQIDKVIVEAGLDPSDEAVEDEAKWVVTQGIPLNRDTLLKTHEFNNISFPVNEKDGAKAIAAAIADNKKAVSANLSDSRSIYEKAEDIRSAVDEITDDDIRTGIGSEKNINIRNLSVEHALNEATPARIAESAVTGDDERAVKARLQLEEVRLIMTTQANRQLLRSGFSIETAPMQDLIDHLKSFLGQMSDEAAGQAVDEITGVTADNRAQVFSFTMSRISIVKSGPAEVSGALFERFTSESLLTISEESQKIARRYEQAGKEYEALGTQVRGDLGDNIKKAFRNVDDILKDLDYELNEDNRRAVRILGYNSMEINKENLDKVRAYDQMLKTTVERLKPGAVLDLIRDDKNPLGMTIEELAGELDGHSGESRENSDQGKSRSDEKYSRFLYKLEHAKEITAEEKDSFIGIYRLFHTLKANDYQAIGSVLKTGNDMTIGNLLTASRTQRGAKRGFDYSVDDSFGGLSVNSDRSSSSLKIDEQIQSAFRFYSAKADIVYENLEPEKLQAVKPDNSTLLTKLADELGNAGADDSLDKEFYAEQVRHIRETIASKEAPAAFDELKAVGLEQSFNNIEAMISNRRSRRSGEIWQKAEGYSGDGFRKEQRVLVDALSEDDYEDTYKNTLTSMSDNLQNLLTQEADNYLDVRAITLLQKQLSVMKSGSEEGSFDVPIEIEGQKISMHITVRDDSGMDSRMEASVQTYEFGLITATLSEKNGVISGMLTTTNSQSSEQVEYLESVRNKMCANLAEKLKDVGVGQDKIAILYHAQTQPTSVGKTNANATDGNSKNKTEIKDLLTMAKAFIEALTT